ncbi:hypothetical protein DOY81_002043 [Sarcophaga bullata]|nr:hypothetical protein DOY81_002043 [Sarcophaga bullata]
MNTKMYNKGTNNNNNNNNNSTTSNLNISISTSSSNGQASANSPGGSSTTATTTTNDRIEWSRATILDFIEDYRRQRVLWDPNTKGYHIKQTKYEALKALGYKYGAEIRSIRSKIKSLRSSFHREHGKVLNGRRKGLNYQPMWFAYDAIRFILDGEAGDSDDAETHKNDSNSTRETILMEPNNNSNNNNNNNRLINIDEELMEERKISSRDIEHFNNHFLALGLQARHPMAVIAAVEAAAAATAAQERRQEQENALRQQQQQIDAATQLKLLELTTNIVKNNKTNNNNDCTLTSTSASQFNPISKSINSSKPTSPLPLVLPAPTSSATITTTSAVTITATATPPPPFSTNTCSSENLNVLHGSHSLDENAALVAATAIPSLSITAVARNSDFDGSEYCNISADDVKTEIFETDSNELAMLESTRTSTPVPLNYHKNITDLTTSKSNTVSGNNSINASISRSNVNGVTGSRKRKLQTYSNINLNHSSEDAPSPSKLQQKQVQQQQQQQQQQQLQHSNAIHSRQCDYLNNNNHNINMNNINSNQSHYHDNNNSTANNENADDNEDDNDDDGVGYSTSFSHLQTTLINAGNNSNGNISGSHNCKLNNGNNNSSTPIDEYGVFGEYVAITIRKLKTSKAKIVVKHLINNLLYEAEMGKYDQGISSCKEPPELYKM